MQTNADGSQQRPYDTVVPLAADLGLTVDTSCQRDDQDCVADVVDNYSGPGNILICWEHGTSLAFRLSCTYIWASLACATVQRRVLSKINRP
jgi:hypothetical protein